MTLLWRQNGRDGVSNYQPHDCLLNGLLRCRSKKTSKLRVTDLRVGNSPVTGEFPAQRASNAENVSIWWRHHDLAMCDKASVRQIVIEFWSCIHFDGLMANHQFSLRLIRAKNEIQAYVWDVLLNTYKRLFEHFSHLHRFCCGLICEWSCWNLFGKWCCTCWHQTISRE